MITQYVIKGEFGFVTTFRIGQVNVNYVQIAIYIAVWSALINDVWNNFSRETDEALQKNLIENIWGHTIC